MRHILIILSFLLLSPFLTSCEKYVGEYKDGKRNGQGTVTWSDGKNYVGEFKDGKFNGQGTFTWADGEQYVGDWKEGFIHGQGTIFFSDGTKIKGEFREDEPWKITVFDKDGNIIRKMLDGVEQKVIYLNKNQCVILNR